jgi:protein-disulfide isomerase
VRPEAPGHADLSSAPVPGLAEDDHLRGSAEAPLLIEYADFECPYCGALEPLLARQRVRHVFRHFPVRSSHPRAWAAACAAEAASLQGRFWEMHDLLFADQSRLEDPHLWERAERLGLDLEDFEADRRSEHVITRVTADFRSGIRAGVVTTPTIFVAGVREAGRIGERRLRALVEDA